MKLSDFDKDSILDMLGLAARPSATSRLFSVAGLFGAGLLAGAALGLLLAPRPGAEMRAEMARRLGMGNGTTPDGESIDELVT
jgi:hypothetical protein